MVVVWDGSNRDLGFVSGTVNTVANIQCNVAMADNRSADQVMP